MNKISIKKLLAVCLAITALISALAAPASAAGYTPIKGGEATFNKYLIVDEKANVPNVTFSYEIAPGTAISATTSTVEVLPGVSGATVGTAAFSANDTKLTEKAAGDTVTLDSGENYVKKTVTLDFTACSFDEPGIYRYILTEQETGGAMGITYDTQKGDGATAKQRTVDVYVTDNGGTLTVSGYIIHENTAAPAAGADNGSAGVRLADKSDGFVNEYETHDLTISKTVTGNQGSKDKYFKFTVKIEGAVAGTKYTVGLDNAEAASGSTSATKSENRGQTNVTELVVKNDGTVEADFYLKHGQSIVIYGLAKGTQYTVTEEAEDYKSSAPDGVTGTIAGEDVTAAFTNTRDGQVPTGVMLSILPGAVLIALGGGAWLLIAAGKRKKNGEA